MIKLPILCALLAGMCLFGAGDGAGSDSRQRPRDQGISRSGGRRRGRQPPFCPPGPVPAEVRPEQYAVYAGVLPEDKYKLVRAFQKGNHIVGMCGDGANDAPALRQAQIGIAVSTATDVAKSAAGMVLTTAGLGGIVAAVNEGRLMNCVPGL